MKLYVGTSGFAYKPWKGRFYPADISEKEMLRFYAGVFNSVEINSSFYRIPDKSSLERWASEVPAEFRFAFKAPQKITHILRLKNCEEVVKYFLETVSVHQARLGPLLFQLPGNFKVDLDRLKSCLDLIPREFRIAFEFRNATWFQPEVFALMRERNAALCIAEADDDFEVPFTPTADWGFLRLRRLDYDEAAIAGWAKRVLQQNWSDAYVYFRHEDTAAGPRFGKMFLAAAENRP